MRREVLLAAYLGVWKTLGATGAAGEVILDSDAVWQSARLIPTSGINGVDEQERRATSAFLAVLASVKEYGRSVLGSLGAPSGQVECFVEVPFELAGKKVFPDGLIRVSKPSRTWTALVEVKTGRVELRREQIESYLDVARQKNFDAVITISNQIAAGQHPVEVDKRKLKSVKLFHLSWTRLLAEAVMQKVHRGVSDPDQAWILGELIRYLEHPKSGALEFEDMGDAWPTVRNAVEAGTIRVSDSEVPDVASAWEQLMQYLALRLGRQLGTDVQPDWGKLVHATRAKSLVQELVKSGKLEGGLRIPHAASLVFVAADLRAKQVTVAVDLEAPNSGRASTRVNWLARQLTNAPDRVRIDAFARHARENMSALLRDVRSDPAVLIQDPKREIRRFRVSLSAAAGQKRGTGRGSFIDSVVDLVDDFYEKVVQDLRAWVHPPPKLQRARGDVDHEPVLVAD